MAANLRTKLPSSDKLVIFDINQNATDSFVKEHEGVEVAQSVREIAEKSVRDIQSRAIRQCMLTLSRKQSLPCCPSRHTSTMSTLPC